VRLTRYLARVRLRHLLTVLQVTLYFRAAVSITWIFKIALLRSPCRQDRHANPELCITCFFLRLLSYFCDTVIVLRLILVTISFNLCEYISYCMNLTLRVMRFAKMRIVDSWLSHAILHSWHGFFWDYVLLLNIEESLGFLYGKDPFWNSINSLKQTLRQCRASQRRSNSWNSRHEGGKIFFHTTCPWVYVGFNK